MFGLIPVSRKPIRDSHKQRIPLNLEGLRRLEPCSDNLLWKLSTRLVEKPSPDVGCGERHLSMWIIWQGRRTYVRNVEMSTSPVLRMRGCLTYLCVRG